MFVPPTTRVDQVVHPNHHKNVTKKALLPGKRMHLLRGSPWPAHHSRQGTRLSDQCLLGNILQSGLQGAACVPLRAPRSVWQPRKTPEAW